MLSLQLVKLRKIRRSVTESVGFEVSKAMSDPVCLSSLCLSLPAACGLGCKDHPLLQDHSCCCHDDHELALKAISKPPTNSFIL